MSYPPAGYTANVALQAAQAWKAGATCVPGNYGTAYIPYPHPFHDDRLAAVERKLTLIERFLKSDPAYLEFLDVEGVMDALKELGNGK